MVDVVQLEKDRKITSSVLPTGAATEATLLLIKDTDGIKKILDALPAGTNSIGKVIVEDVEKTATLKQVNATTSGNTTWWDPAAGKALRLKFLFMANDSTSTVSMGARFGTSGTIYFYQKLVAGAAVAMNLMGCNWEGATNEILYIWYGGGAVSTIRGTALGEEV